MAQKVEIIGELTELLESFKTEKESARRKTAESVALNDAVINAEASKDLDLKFEIDPGVEAVCTSCFMSYWRATGLSHCGCEGELPDPNVEARRRMKNLDNKIELAGANVA